jgi:hypothetical protein
MASQRENREQPGDRCEPQCDPSHSPAPPREGGGTTGAGNLSPGQASRTGGATSGVESQDITKPTPADTLPPDA